MHKFRVSICATCNFKIMFVTMDTDGAWPICLANLWERYVEASSGRLWADADDIQEYSYEPLLFHFIIRFLGQGYLYIYWDEVSLSDVIVAGARTESILRKIIHQPIIISNFPGIRFLIQWLEFISRELSAIACWPRWRGNILSRPPLLWCS